MVAGEPKDPQRSRRRGISHRSGRRSGPIDDTLLSSDSLVHGRDAMGGLAPGKAIGRYIVLGRVGAGDKGVVYRAHDPKLDRKVALRLLRPHPGANEDIEQALARVAAEAKLLAEISHTNLIPILDIGTIHGVVYVALEYVDGISLRAWIEQAGAPHPWPEVLARLRGAARGLAAAHRAGVVHRDFRPDNVLVDRNGDARITDLGLARPRANAAEASGVRSLRRAEDDTSVESLTAPLTRAGQWLGTPAYMAPEQYAGERIDGRADQFSFCVVLYEALYRERPFAGRTVQAIMLACKEGKVRPPAKGSHVPRWLRKHLIRGLAHDPAQRWPDMESLLHALEREGLGDHRRLGATAAFAVALLAGGLAVIGDARTPSTPAADATDPATDPADVAPETDDDAATLREAVIDGDDRRAAALCLEIAARRQAGDDRRRWLALADGFAVRSRDPDLRRRTRAALQAEAPRP